MFIDEAIFRFALFIASGVEFTKDVGVFLVPLISIGKSNYLKLIQLCTVGSRLLKQSSMFRMVLLNEDWTLEFRT
jgi:hypothetical protein